MPSPIKHTRWYRVLFHSTVIEGGRVDANARVVKAKAWHKCARKVCQNEGKHPHRDLPGRYCRPCGLAINDANGIELVDLKVVVLVES